MRYKFTEIKGIKRIRKLINSMNECDIQYPKLDEDFVTTDTDQDISGRKSLSELKIYTEDKRVLPRLQDNILFGNILNESFINEDSGYNSKYNVPEYREYSLRGSHFGLSFQKLIYVQIGDEEADLSDTLFSGVNLRGYNQASMVNFTSIDSSKYEATIVANANAFNVDIPLLRGSAGSYRQIRNCRVYVSMTITEESFSSDGFYENKDFVDIGSGPVNSISLFKNKEIKILTSTNNYSTFLTNAYNMKIAIRIVKNVEGSLLKDSSYNLGTNNRRLKCAYLDEIDVKHNYVKSLTLKGNNLFEYMDISKEATFNKDNYGNPLIYSMTNLDSLAKKYPSKDLCDLYIAGYDYVLASGASKIDLDPGNESTLVFVKGNYVKTSSQHAPLLPTRITLDCKISLQKSIKSYLIETPTLQVEFDSSAFNKEEYNKFKFYPHIEIGNFSGRYAAPLDPEAYYGRISDSVISVGGAYFTSNGIDNLYDPGYCFNPGVSTSCTIRQAMLNTSIVVPYVQDTSDVYIECSVIMYYATRQKENLAGITTSSITSMIDLGCTDPLRRLNTIYCNAIDISQSAKLPHIYFDGSTLKVPVGATLKVRVFKVTYGSDAAITIEPGTELVVSNNVHPLGYMMNAITINGNNKMCFYPIVKRLGATAQDTFIRRVTVTPGKYIAFEGIEYSADATDDASIDVTIQRIG